MFENLVKMYIADREKDTANIMFYIENGYYPTWSEEHRNDPDAGIRRHATANTWEKYKAGAISREEAVKRAQKRAQRAAEKQTAAGLAKIEAAAAADDLNYINISVEFIRSRTWGYNPRAEVYANIETIGTASGCGYDKESAAVAEALNANPAIMKILYTIKETGLAQGKTSESETACTGHDNRNICGYGAGYSAIPYFEAGVGVSCFWSILEKAGYKTRATYGKHENFYSITKE